MRTNTISHIFFKKNLIIFAAVAFLAAAVFITLPARPTNAAACNNPSTDYGSATMTVSIPETATYRIWSRMMVPNNSNNTYLLEVDGQHCFTVGGAISSSVWTWVAHQNSNTSAKIDVLLSKGVHTVKLIGRHPGVKVNRLAFASDLNCTPTDNGSNCDNPPDATPPSVTLTAPADNSTATGEVKVTATASDNVKVSKVELYLNSSLLNVDANAPYEFTWNSATMPNGQQLLTVKAYDESGNVVADSIHVTVQNGDVKPPAPPKKPKAKAKTYTKVQVSWKPSNTPDVAGYSISRNGQFLAEVDSNTTTYEDTSVLPNTQYEYNISSGDSSGNASSKKAVTKVKTPNVKDAQPPSAPTEFSATSVSPTQINLKWRASKDNIAVAGYDVYRNSKKVATVTTASFGDAGLNPDTTYTYTVRARDRAGNASEPSAEANVATKSLGQQKVVRGKIIDGSNGRPLRFALVEVKIANKRHFSFANQKGVFTLRNIEPGTYNVTYRAFGHRSKSVRVTVDDNRRQLLEPVSLQKRSSRN